MALLACALACLPAMPVRANDSAHSVAEKFASETERERALADFCQVLMCLNEFVYVD